MGSRESPGRDYVPLGVISGIHGLKGGVKVHSYTRPREAIFDFGAWRLGDERRPVKVESGGPSGKTLVAKLAEIDDRESARVLIGQEIAVLRSDLPELASGEYYWADLLGLEVFNREGQALGTVERMMETGANDVLVIRGEKEHLVPYVPGQYVLRIDLEAGRMEVDWDSEF
jgi:16S rRNA processing protein RimM